MVRGDNDKGGLIDSLAKRFELPRQRAEDIVGELFDDMCAALKKVEGEYFRLWYLFSVPPKGKDGEEPENRRSNRNSSFSSS